MKSSIKAIPLELLMEQLPENYTIADRELIQRDVLTSRVLAPGADDRSAG